MVGLFNRAGGREAADKLAAIDRSQAVIEFEIDGTIITANDNFLKTMGYTHDEIAGRHHRTFVEPRFAESAEYREFWEALGRGEFRAAEYKRIGKGGREAWIQASYNPLIGADSIPYKVVKFAADVTGRKQTVDKLSDRLMRLADGRLAATLDDEVPPEFAPVRDALNQGVQRFATVIDRLSAAAESLKTATGEILSGANDLSERTTK